MDSKAPLSCVHVLLDIARGLSHRTSIQKTLEEICSHLDAFFSPKHLAVLFVEPETGDLTFSHVIGDKNELLGGKKIRKGKGIAGWVAETGDSLLIENAETDPRFAAYFVSQKTKNSSTIMAVPLKTGDMVYGVIELIDRQSGLAFTASNVQDLAGIADVTTMALERAYYFQAMKRMAETDLLTGLPNKRTFERYLAREVEICKRYGTPSTVLLLTLENLRGLNDQYGTTTADKIIQLLAGIMTEDLRKVDVPCRIGSNRFAIIMPNTTRMPATEVSQRINTKILQHSTARQLPFFSVTMNVRSGSQDDITPLLGISEISRAGTQGFRKFRNVAANLFQLFNEEKQSLERRQYYRKNVKLAGSYENPQSGESMDFLLENLSLNGIGFTTLLDHRLKKNDLLRLRFRLDDSRRSEINRLAKVKYINERYVGIQFADQKSYDSDLGFYLMR